MLKFHFLLWKSAKDRTTNLWREDIWPDLTPDQRYALIPRCKEYEIAILLDPEIFGVVSVDLTGSKTYNIQWTREEAETTPADYLRDVIGIAELVEQVIDDHTLVLDY